MPDYRNYGLINLRTENIGGNFNVFNAINVLQIFLWIFLVFFFFGHYLYPFNCQSYEYTCAFRFAVLRNPIFLTVAVKGFAVFLI